MCSNTPVCNVYRLWYYWFFEDASLLHGSSDTLLNRGVIPSPISTQTVTYITHNSHSQCIKICCPDSSLKCFKCWVGMRKKNKWSCLSHWLSMILLHTFRFSGFVLKRLSSGGFLMMLLVRKQMNMFLTEPHTSQVPFIIVSHPLPKTLLVLPKDEARTCKGGVWDVFGEKPSSHISLSKYSCWMFQAIAFTCVSTDCAVTLTWCIMQQDVCLCVCMIFFFT